MVTRAAAGSCWKGAVDVGQVPAGLVLQMIFWQKIRDDPGLMRGGRPREHTGSTSADATRYIFRDLGPLNALPNSAMWKGSRKVKMTSFGNVRVYSPEYGLSTSAAVSCKKADGTYPDEFPRFPVPNLDVTTTMYGSRQEPGSMLSTYLWRLHAQPKCTL